jgi:DNA polymerase IV (family X)
MDLSDAHVIAADLVKRLAPFCERVGATGSVAIAGSVRRQCRYVKDVEIVAVPRWDEEIDPESLFGATKKVNALYEAIAKTPMFGIVSWIKTGTDEQIPWSIKPEGKYWRGLLTGGIKLDLFLARPDNFGLIYCIRTGSAEFSKALVTHAANVGMPCVDGYLTHGGAPVPTPGERDVFDALGLKFIPPQDRIDERSLEGIPRFGDARLGF